METIRMRVLERLRRSWRADPRALGRAATLVWVAAAEAWRCWRGRQDVAEAIHRAVVRLGPTFIKLAQLASTRPDLVRPAIAERLRSLQENAPRLDFQTIRTVVEGELGCALTDAFRCFERRPAAAASLAQVHFAELADGTPVAVKVQRPGMSPLIERDVAVLAAIARLLEMVWPLGRRLGLVRAVREFGRWTLAELDFRAEAANLEEFRVNFRAQDDVWFPAVYPALSSRRVLTLERIEGLRVGEVAARRGAHYAQRMAGRLAEIEIQMFVADAFFHADLHPGNVFFTTDGRIAMLDVGMVGRLSVRERDRFLAYWIAISRRRRERAFTHLLALAESTATADLEGYRHAYDQVLDRFYDKDLGAMSLARTYLEVVSAGARFGVVFAPSLLLQAKAVVTAEALTAVLAPEFRFTEEVRPIVARELARRATPARLRERAWDAWPEWVLFGEIVADTGADHAPIDADERSFRRLARQALAAAWSDAGVRRLAEAELRLPSRASAGWWRSHPERRALLRGVIAVARGAAAEVARLVAEQGGRGSPKERPGVSDRRGPEALPGDVVALLDRLDEELCRAHRPAVWQRRAGTRAGLLGMSGLLRLVVGSLGRVAREQSY